MKQQTRNRVRRLTRAQKVLAVREGLDPQAWRYAGENMLYLFLINRSTEDRVSVRK